VSYEKDDTIYIEYMPNEETLAPREEFIEDFIFIGYL
jgi:hypothetical protein